MAASGFDEDQVMDMRDCFSLFDKVGDGKVEISEIQNVLRALGYNPMGEDVKKIEKELGDGADRVAFENFMAVVAAHGSKIRGDSTSDYTTMVEGLRVFDKESNGYISSSELRHILTTLGDRLSDEDVDDLLQGLENSHGQINYEDFVQLIRT
ncbi:myosin-2 essential light chain-like [Ptychodera flava]|uniref:myosin-2 essential light chain-like n=1 Tax=Ptychodera flava TaxID=63121 RepID=UPI00396A0BA9